MGRWKVNIRFRPNSCSVEVDADSPAEAESKVIEMIDDGTLYRTPSEKADAMDAMMDDVESVECSERLVDIETGKEER